MNQCYYFETKVLARVAQGSWWASDRLRGKLPGSEVLGHPCSQGPSHPETRPASEVVPTVTVGGSPRAQQPGKLLFINPMKPGRGGKNGKSEAMSVLGGLLRVSEHTSPCHS